MLSTTEEEPPLDTYCVILYEFDKFYAIAPWTPEFLSICLLLKGATPLGKEADSCPLGATSLALGVFFPSPFVGSCHSLLDEYWLKGLLLWRLSCITPRWSPIVLMKPGEYMLRMKVWWFLKDLGMAFFLYLVSINILSKGSLKSLSSWKG